MAISAYLVTQSDLKHAVYNVFIHCRTYKNLSHLRDILTVDYREEDFVVYNIVKDSDSSGSHSSVHWTVIFDMIRRYVRLYAALHLLNDRIKVFTPASTSSAVGSAAVGSGVSGVGVVHLPLPTTEQHARIVSLLADLKELQEIALMLRQDDCTLLQARNCFEGILIRHEGKFNPSMHHYLAPDSPLIQSQSFIDGVVKVMKGIEVTLTTSEAAAVEPFLLANAAAVPHSTATSLIEQHQGGATVVPAESSAHSTKKARITPTTSTTSQYIDLSFINPTAVDTDNLYNTNINANDNIADDGQADEEDDEKRPPLSTTHINNRLFLAWNSSMWDMNTICDILRGLNQTRKELEALDV